MLKASFCSYFPLEKDGGAMEAEKSKCYCNQCKDTKDGEREHAECLKRCKSKLYMFEFCFVRVWFDSYFDNIFERKFLKCCHLCSQCYSVHG